MICALSNVVLNRSFEWRGRPKLETVVSRYAECSSVTSTADEMNKGMPDQMRQRVRSGCDDMKEVGREGLPLYELAKRAHGDPLT